MGLYADNLQPYPYWRLWYMASFDIWNNRQRGFAQLTLHTKVMLVGELVLVVAGTLSILGLEWTQTLAGLPFTTKIQGALFQAITPRTAGIPTLNYADLHPITVFITVVLMFIGAGPNSTGGGIKNQYHGCIMGPTSRFVVH